MNVEPARITLVQSEGCHLCDDAHGVLDVLASRGQVQLNVIAARSAEGMSLVSLHRPSMFPLVLIDDEPFSQGRLPRRKLAKRLALGADDVRVG